MVSYNFMSISISSSFKFCKNPIIPTISSKIFYNSLLLILIGFVTLFFHALLGAASIKNYSLFALAIVLGGIAFSATLTIVSALSAKAENTSTLVAVISFPLIIPMLTTLITITQAAMDGLYFADVSDRITMVFGVSIALSGLSVILFPFVWRD